MSMVRKLGSAIGPRAAVLAIIAVSLVVNLLIFDILGAVLWFLISLFDGRRVSLAACYAVWGVMGIFAGGMHYSGAVAACLPEHAAGAPAVPPSRWLGISVVAVTLMLLFLIAWLFDSIWWEPGVKFGGYAPDNEVPTLVFFGAMICSMLLARHVNLEEIHSKKG